MFVVPWKQRKRFYIRANTNPSTHRPQSHLDVFFCILAVVVVHMNNTHPVKVIFCQCMPEYIVDTALQLCWELRKYLFWTSRLSPCFSTEISFHIRFSSPGMDGQRDQWPLISGATKKSVIHYVEMHLHTCRFPSAEYTWHDNNRRPGKPHNQVYTNETTFKCGKLCSADK